MTPQQPTHMHRAGLRSSRFTILLSSVFWKHSATIFKDVNLMNYWNNYCWCSLQVCSPMKLETQSFILNLFIYSRSATNHYFLSWLLRWQRVQQQHFQSFLFRNRKYSHEIRKLWPNFLKSWSQNDFYAWINFISWLTVITVKNSCACLGFV